VDGMPFSRGIPAPPLWNFTIFFPSPKNNKNPKGSDGSGRSSEMTGEGMTGEGFQSVFVR